MNKSKARIITVSLIGLAGVIGAGVAIAASTRSTGPDYAYGVDNPFADATASVLVVGRRNDTTLVTLNIRNVEADSGRTFGAHIHALPCGASGADAGPHYLHVASDPQASLEQREVWLDFTVNRAGNGHSIARRPWIVDQASPRSVIIHALPTAPDGTAGTRLACIDLDGS